MSNARRLRHRRPRPPAAPPVPRWLLEQVAHDSAARRGCTCAYDLEVRHDAAGMPHATIRHDDWCPAHPEALA